MKSEIIAIGSEMLTPYRQDTNSLDLTEKLNEIGVMVAFKTIVADRRKALVKATRARPPRHHHPHGRPGPHGRRPDPRSRRGGAFAYAASRQYPGRRSACPRG